MATEPKTVQTTKRLVWDGTDALAGLANQQWKSTSIALAIGRTFRRLRSLYEDIDKDRQVILSQHAVKDEDGSLVREQTGQTRLSDAVSFNKDWAKLLAEEVDVEVYPFKLSALVANGKKKQCSECKRSLAVQLSAYQLDVLAEIGVLIVDDATEGEE